MTLRNFSPKSGEEAVTKPEKFVKVRDKKEHRSREEAVKNGQTKRS